MGLDAEQAEGIRMGAGIHDIGKIQVPAEILSKPGRLSDVEYSIIQEHPKVGYSILNKVAFPWPVADIAHQHHERMDGSGYPQGLKGEEICLEARIVAVADVTEAMLSHRPYRTAFTLEEVLAEIESGRGLRFDEQAVDACLQLFHDKKFDFAAV
jgi:putative nucleotidyltransferase with HDIG domain